MSHNKAALYHSNGYNAQAACEPCEGIIRHELWCQTLNPVVCYAYKIVVSADELAIGDAIILHSLGVLWTIATSEFNAPAGTKSVVVKGFSRFENPLSLDCVLSQFAR